MGVPWPAYLFLLLLLVSGLYRWNQHRYEFDDAYISYRYAHNLSSGNGLVFNAGDRVEGYSNLLWVLFLAAGSWMGIPPPFLAPILGVLSYLLTLGACWCVVWIGIEDWRPGQRVVASALLVSLVLSHGLAETSGSGLETHFYAALVLLSLTSWAMIDRTSRVFVPALGVLLSLLVLTRPDGVLTAGVILILECGRSMSGRRGLVTAIRAIRPIALVPATTVAVHWTWRMLYYGSFLPNPYFAKVGDTPQYRAGMAYLWAFLSSYPAVVLLLGFVVIHLLAPRGWDSRRRYVLAALVVSLLYAAFAAGIGGDFMEYRLCLLFLPTLLLAGIIGAVDVIPAGFAGGCVVAGIVLVLCLAPARLEMDYYMQSLKEMDGYVSDGAAVGRALKDLPPDTRVATTLIGTIGYYSELDLVDQWGLVDRNVRKRPPRQPFVRGHVRFTSPTEASDLGADFYMEHPHFCDCSRACLKSEHEVAIQLADARCARALVLSKKVAFREFLCARQDKFPVVGHEVCSR